MQLYGLAASKSAAGSEVPENISLIANLEGLA